MVRTSEVEALMKGSLHTDELMHEVIAKETGLRTGRRISHVFVVDVPTCPRPLFITDAAVHTPPDLAAKIAVGTVVAEISAASRGMQRVVFCCFSQDSAKHHMDAFAGLGLA